MEGLAILFKLDIRFDLLLHDFLASHHVCAMTKLIDFMYSKVLDHCNSRNLRNFIFDNLCFFLLGSIQKVHAIKSIDDLKEVLVSLNFASERLEVLCNIFFSS